jgi:YD repeat-containing protein
MKLKTALLLSSVVSASIVLSGGTVHAGFEWTPPSQSEPGLSEIQNEVPSRMLPDETGLVPPMDENVVANPMPEEAGLGMEDAISASPSVPQNNVQTQTYVSPPVDDGAPLSVVAPASAPIHNLSPEQVLKAPSAPVSARAQYIPPAVSTPASSPMPVQAAEPVSPMDETVNGFGKDVPLITAVRQLVPASYTYKFTPDVDLGTRVSWNGGQSLSNTLSSVLASGGYTYDLQGNMISITSTHQKSAAVSPAMAPPQDNLRDIPGFNDVIQQNIAQAEAEAENIAPPIEQIASTPDIAQEKQVYVKPMSSPVSLVTPKVEYNAADDMMVPLMEEASASTAKMVAPPAPFANGMHPTYLPVSLSSYPETQQVRTWNVKRNSDLKSTLAGWTRQAGVGLQWNADRNFRVDYMVWVDGTFEEAIDVLMKGYADKEGPVPHTRFELQQNQQPVLVVDTVTR